MTWEQQDRAVYTGVGILMVVAVLWVLFIVWPAEKIFSAQSDAERKRCREQYEAGRRDWQCAQGHYPTVNTRICRQVPDGKSTKTVCEDY